MTLLHDFVFSASYFTLLLIKFSNLFVNIFNNRDQKRFP